MDDDGYPGLAAGSELFDGTATDGAGKLPVERMAPGEDTAAATDPCQVCGRRRMLAQPVSSLPPSLGGPAGFFQVKNERTDSQVILF